jgi:hypothetical protein
MNPDVFNNSAILTTHAQRTFVNSLLIGAVLNPKVTRLYQATVDGFSKEKFYEKSIDKGATMTIVKTTTGRIFGGFTKTSWDKSGNYKHDTSSFIFSVDY